MVMQQAFESYFEKLERFALEEYGTKPTVSFSEHINEALLISAPDEDGEAEWEPILQSVAPPWRNIEQQLGIELSAELKDFYSTYFFLSLAGKLNNTFLNFYPIDGARSIEDVVIQNFNDAQTVFPGSPCFLLGNALVVDDDSYFLYYDNAACELFCYESDTQQRVTLSGTLAEIVSSMEARD